MALPAMPVKAGNEINYLPNYNFLFFNILVMKDNLKFLIVDDDADDRMLFIDAVTQIDPDIECKIAGNGQEALDGLKNTVCPLPDFIFLDLRMPRLNGQKCLSEIKSDERLKHIPVIIYTTSKDVDESKELREMGAFHFISKPRNNEEIYYLISFVLAEQLRIMRRNQES
jgi:DNA-binding NtrC family response regulator